MTDKPFPTRSEAQRNSIQVYCRLLAEAMNEAGYDLKTIVEMIVRSGVPLTMENVKETIWRSVQKSMFHIHSTTALDTKQVNEVYETINRDIVPTGIHIPFPSQLEKALRQQSESDIMNSLG